MKLLLGLMLCAVAAAAPKSVQPVHIQPVVLGAIKDEVIIADVPAAKNLLVNSLIRSLIAYIRNIINNGSPLFGIPPLDPLTLDHMHLTLPAGLLNLDLELKDIYATGFGGFVVHRSNLDLTELSFDLDISVPRLDISTQFYDMTGDILTAIPLYGKGDASFLVEGFRFQAKLFLRQSEDGQAVIINSIENVAFQIPNFKSEITGAIGGGNIDKIVNAMIEEVIIGYINRFQGAISLLASPVVMSGLNPILEVLDSWKYIAPLLPRTV